jgi:hypothetical protein
MCGIHQQTYYEDDVATPLAKKGTHCPTEFGSTVWTLAYNADHSRVAGSLGLKLATFLGGHFGGVIP